MFSNEVCLKISIEICPFEWNCLNLALDQSEFLLNNELIRIELIGSQSH